MPRSFGDSSNPHVRLHQFEERPQISAHSQVSAAPLQGPCRSQNGLQESGSRLKKSSAHGRIYHHRFVVTIRLTKWGCWQKIEVWHTFGVAPGYIVLRSSYWVCDFWACWCPKLDVGRHSGPLHFTSFQCRAAILSVDMSSNLNMQHMLES